MATLILADGTRLDGEVPLSHAFVARPLPNGGVMLDSTSASGDDGEIADLSAYYRLLGNVDFTGYGTLLVDNLFSSGDITVANTVRGGDFGAFNDPQTDTYPTVSFNGGVSGISFGTGSAPVDTRVGRTAAGIFAASAGLIRANELGGASKDSAYHLARANHTGTQLAATISDLASAVALLDAATVGTRAPAYLLARANHTGTQAFGTITGTVPVAQGGLALTTVSAGGMLYASALDTYAVLAKPGATSVLTHDATSPVWAAALAKAQQHAQTAYLDAVQTFTANQRIDGLVGIGVAATSSTGFNCRPTAMSGTTQIGATYAPAWTIAGTTEEVGLQISGVGAASGSPYTTTDVRIAKIQAPTRGSNQTITNLTGLRIDDISGVTAGSKKAVDAASSFQADYSSTTDDTRFLLWDVTAGSMKRVSRGASDSGGTGFRLLRIPN